MFHTENKTLFAFALCEHSAADFIAVSKNVRECFFYKSSVFCKLPMKNKQGSKKEPFRRLGQVDFLARQVTFSSH